MAMTSLAVPKEAVVSSRKALEEGTKKKPKQKVDINDMTKSFGCCSIAAKTNKQ